MDGAPLPPHSAAHIHLPHRASMGLARLSAVPHNEVLAVACLENAPWDRRSRVLRCAILSKLLLQEGGTCVKSWSVHQRSASRDDVCKQFGLADNLARE